MKASTTQPSISDCEIDHLQRLATALTAMQQSATLTDVTLLCGQREFQAHRLVLISLSQYFRSALTNGWMEMTSGYIDLTMISAEAMESILMYMYIGQFEDGSEDKFALMELVENADYLQLDGLVQLSFCRLAQLHLTAKDFIEMYDYVQELGNQRMINHVAEFLGENYVEMSRCPDFLLLTVEQLERIVQYTNMGHLASMESIFTSILQWTSFKMERVEFLEHLMNILGHRCVQCFRDLKEKNVLEQWNPEIISSLIQMEVNVTGNEQTQNEKRKLLVFGRTGEKSVSAFYDVEENEWRNAQVLPFILKREMHVVACQCHAYIFWGGDELEDLKPFATVIKYCPLTNTLLLHLEDGLPYPLSRAGIGVLNDLIYIVNGIDQNYSALTTVYRYDPRDDTCQPVAPTNRGHCSPVVMPFNGSLYAVGSIFDDDKYLERYDPVADQWTVVTEVPGFVDDCVAAMCDGKLFVVRGTAETKFHVYDFHSAMWTVREFVGVPTIRNWLWATMVGGRPILFFHDFIENVVHQYDVKFGMRVAKSLVNKDVGEIVFTCKFWCD